MEILEAFDLTGTLRGAAELAGCDHKTVAHWVRARELAGGGLPAPTAVAAARGPLRGEDRGVGRALARADPRGRRASAAGRDGIRGLGAHDPSRGCGGQASLAREHGRRYRPWVAEPGLWMQWDYGDGPTAAGRATVLFCAWLAWSRFRVVLPLWDRTMPSVVMAPRSGAAGIRRRADLRADRQREHGLDRSCVRDRGAQPADRRRCPPLRADDRDLRPGGPAEQGRLGSDRPDRQGGSGPDRPQPRAAYASFARARAPRARSSATRVNAREHRVTRRAPAVMLAEERGRLHPLPTVPHTVCFGQTRRVCRQSTISVGGATTPSRARWSTSASGRASMAPSSSSCTPTARTGRARSPATS